MGFSCFSAPTVQKNFGATGAENFFPPTPPTPLRGPKSYPPGVPKIGLPGGAKIFRPPPAADPRGQVCPLPPGPGMTIHGELSFTPPDVQSTKFIEGFGPLLPFFSCVKQRWRRGRNTHSFRGLFYLNSRGCCSQGKGVAKA